MAFSALNIISPVNARRIICSYHLPLISQLRYLGGRLSPISASNFPSVPRVQGRILHLPEKFTSRQSFVRWNSLSSASSVAQNANTGSPAGQYIPEPPSPPPVDPDISSEVVEQLTSLGEPTLQSLGLATWYPSGLVQWGLEAIHVGLDVPWWTSIVIGTVIVRIALFPLIIYIQRNMAAMNNYMPVIQRMQEQMTQARRSGDMLEASRIGVKMFQYTKEHKVRPMLNALGPMSQVPIFISVFVGIRQMANLPVESMKTGGLAWFTDLTVSDPYFALPVMTMALLSATIEVGADGVKAAHVPKTARLFMRLMPVFILPFIMTFPSGLLCYWFTSNGVSLVQAAFLRIPGVRQALNIPASVTPVVDPTKKKSIVETVKQGWKDIQQIDVESLQRSDATKFKEAGLGAVPKTYPYNPTKIKKAARN